MAKKFMRGLSLLLAMIMCISTFSFVATAKTPLENGNTWYGDEVKLPVIANDDAYNYMIAQPSPYYYYETSNHTLKIANAGAVHIFPVIDTNRDTEDGHWTPDGVYKSGDSNYTVVYCCDAITGTREDEEDITNTYYKRLNLEDSEYFSVEQAERLRAILSVSYPALSVEDAKVALKAAGFEQADMLDRSELIAATQGAIWRLVNADSIIDGVTDYRYRTTVSTSRKAGWGGYLHDYSGEQKNFTDGLKDTAIDAIGARINALQDFFVNTITPVKAEDGQVVITKLDIVSSKIFDAKDKYDVTLNVELNHAISESDDISIIAYVSNENGVKEVKSKELGAGKNHSMQLQAEANDDIKVVVSGTQILERGVYFYSPKPQDIDGDGIATSREVSQNLIGVAAGETPVHAEAEATIRGGNIIEKESTTLYNENYTDVTLSVNGDVEYNSGESLPVDIIYILGGFLSADEVKTNTMISALTDTFRELIGEGIPVNFGIVPFSSTKDPVMPLTSLTCEADLEALPDKIAAAIQEAGNVYDQVNMENALLTATEMFGASELGMMGRTDRQHLVMISSGHTYFFNSGDNNEYISTVPVSFKNGSVDTNEVFYMEKAWMRARNNSTNSYPVPKAISEYYKANIDKYESEWDCYWSLIDAWAKADIAAGDTVVYEATTREAADFIAWMNSGKYSSNSSVFTYSGNGAVVSNLGNNKIEDVLEFDMTNSAERGVVHGVSGPNPFLDESAAHAISYERAMWEAYTFIQENITGKKINFYPVYNPLRENGTASNGSHYDYTWTTNYIGHCFMNMLAGGEAVWYSADKVFFDGIKAEIVGGSNAPAGEATTPFVEDFIGCGDDYNFDFTGENIVLELNGVPYTTAEVDAMNGADASYTFSKEGKVCFTMDYFKGNGTTEERFVWYFLESLEDGEVTLTYQLELVKKSDEAGTHVGQTNQSATLYPTGDRNYGQLFPVPEVEYTVVNLKLQKVDLDGNALTGAEFTLVPENGEANTVGVDENGVIYFEDLAPGKYTLTETKAPEGYNALAEEIIFTVTEKGTIVLGDTEDVGFAEVSVTLNPGKTTTSTAANEYTYEAADGLVKLSVDNSREVTVDASEIKVEASEIKLSDVTTPQSALKFDRNSSADQKAQQKIRDLYTDIGHFTDPASVTVTSAPANAPFKYIGSGDYSGHYVSHIRVVYERDEAGNAVKDENGNYVIKELQHSNGTTLTTDLVPTTDFNGPFDQTTGTRPLQFLLKNEAGDTVYGYCIDLETGAQNGTWYSIGNLEDNDYYASEEAEDHIRAIVTNGYWGTAESEDFGNLTTLKAALKAALAEGKIDSVYDVNFRNRVANKGQELTEDQYASTNYVYTKLSQEVTLTEEIIDGLTNGEALDAMQCAIWSYANGSNHALDGTDRMIIGDMYYASSAMGDSRNGVNDFEGAARTKALYQYLTTLDGVKAKSVIINDKSFAENMSLVVGDKVADGIYNAAIKFTIGEGLTVNEEKDNLTIVFTYVDANGETQTITKTLTGEGALVADENGYYTIDGLTLKENDKLDFSINIAGEQYLERGAYVFTAEGGVDKSQTMVTAFEGTNTVNVTKTLSFEFNVTEKTDNVLTVVNKPVPEEPEFPATPETPDEPTEPEEKMTVSFNSGDASNISFMLIDPATGKVEFIKKIDIGSETSFEIPAEEGKISAVFVKQSTSGMFWIAEEVDEATVNAVIACLKANNPSYKGYNALAFGEGDHELEFKKNKFVTYTFTGCEEVTVDTGDNATNDKPVVDEPVVEEPVVEEPVVEEDNTSNKNNGNNKNKDKNNGNNKNKNKNK